MSTIVWPNQTTFTDSGLTATTKYYYRIRASNDFNTTSYSPYVTAAPVTTLVTGAVAPVDIYHFDEDQGATTADSNGFNNGQLIGSPSAAWIPSTRLGSTVLSFAGNEQYNQQGESAVQLNRDLCPVLGGTSSLLYWIKTTQAGNSTHWQAPAITGIEQGNLGNDINWGYMDGSGHIGIAVGDSGGCVSSQAINDGNWHHVAITRDAGTGVVIVYVDGTESNSATLEFGQVTPPFNLIGANSVYASGFTGANFLNAQLDDVQIYNQVLSPAVIASDAVPVGSIAATSASSELNQGSALLIPLALQLTGTPTIEPRIVAGATTGSYAIIINFNSSITAVAGATLSLQSGQSGTVAGTATAPTVTGSSTSITVQLTGVKNAQRLNLHLGGIQPGFYTADIPLNILWGDANGDGSVTSADVTPIKTAYGSSYGSSTYNLRADLNSDGSVSSTDINPVKLNYSLRLP